MSEFEAPFPVWGNRGMAACDHPLAAQAACDVLAEGGNVVDAAVTLSLTLGVVCPYYTGIGGGGFMLLWLPEFPTPRLIDFRETAPRLSERGMFVDKPNASTRGGLAVGIPGSIAGLAEVLEKFGSISWERALQPGIRAAEEGFPVYPNLVRVIRARRRMLGLYPGPARMFLGPKGQGLEPGEILRQPELGQTYRALARNGPREFYEGEIGRRIVEAIAGSGGILDAKDLVDYKPLWREPLTGVYRGHELFTVGPPSAGGLQLLQMLEILQPFRFSPSRARSASTYHLQVEAMRLSFADRSTSVADPAYFPVPIEALLDPARLAELHLRIDPKRAMDLIEMPPIEMSVGSTGGTASYVVASKEGGMIAATESVNLWFGSLVMPEGTGFLLNDIMDDFSRMPGTPDAFGLVSSRINQVEPGKRPASSSCPVLVARNGRPWLAAGSAGGSRIATSVLQILMNVIDHEMNVRQAMDAFRVHHQWLPNEVQVEKMIPEDVRRALRALGHEVLEGPCRSHGCCLQYSEASKLLSGAGDFRAGGAARGL